MVEVPEVDIEDIITIIQTMGGASGDKIKVNIGQKADKKHNHGVIDLHMVLHTKGDQIANIHSHKV